MPPHRPIRIAAVSYTNTYPFLHGLAGHAVMEEIDLQLDIPSACARKLLTGEVDIGLVPVAVIPQLKDARIISDFCIGADGPVDSVCLFSEVPIEQVSTILLDHHSRTSVQLMRLLATRHFHIAPQWLAAEEGYIDRISGTTAGVVIGDRAFPLREQFPVVIDLAEVWKELTGLPFVFACWVSNKPLSPAFITAFNAALQQGVDHREEAVRSRVKHHPESLIHYVNHRISYELDERKLASLQLFMRWSIEV